MSLRVGFILVCSSILRYLFYHNIHFVVFLSTTGILSLRITCLSLELHATV